MEVFEAFVSFARCSK